MAVTADVWVTCKKGGACGSKLRAHHVCVALQLADELLSSLKLAGALECKGLCHRCHCHDALGPGMLHKVQHLQSDVSVRLGRLNL